MSKETLAFQTEVSQLLNLMIHSLYSNRDIFLRELASNASDACDKLRVEALADDSLYEDNSDLNIKVDFDEKARTVTVTDNGVGMSREEIISNLGTIAKSGTKEFFNKLSGDKAKDSALIGQFGVGFYSSFIVASKVVVKTRRAGLKSADAISWESDGVSGFSIQQIDRIERGTEVTLFLRDGKSDNNDKDQSYDDLLSHWKLKEIIKRYSDHIGIPIKMKKREWDEKKSAYIELDEYEIVTKASALWTRPKQKIKENEYKEFYKSFANGIEDPLSYTHNKVEGRSEYIQLLYIPSKAPFDLYDRQQRHGLKLYIKRVFIMDDAEQLLPNYLRFVQGVVDSSDLPLNISREILQESRDIKAIREGCAKRTLTLLNDLMKNKPEEYKLFWKEFGQCIKEGFGEDVANKDKLADLLKFKSTFDDSEPSVSLRDYVSRMKSGQANIYVITGDNVQAVKYSPHLEIFKKKEVEVLYLTDRVDEWMLNFLTEYDGKTIQSVAKGSVDLEKIGTESDKEKLSEDGIKSIESKAQPVIDKAKKILGGKVKDIRLTKRLTDSACCLVSDDNDVSGHLERLLKSAGQNVPDRKPILELNPTHPIVEALIKESDAAGGQIVGADGSQVSDGVSPVFSDLVSLLFDQALLAEGGQPDDPASFVRRLNGFLLEGLSK
ncbi:MAG: molecular chaperone HtpG [Betaproteobacteria bacterium TMED41]|nr:MAG: molecular chaperone HtpG [Betaproteobacteria bacterium TMED41]